MGTQAMIGILGIVIGAVSQYFLTKILEDKRHRRDLRTQAYLDYIKCCSNQDQLKLEDNSPEAFQIYSQTRDAEIRVALLGSSKTVQALAKFNMEASLGTKVGRDTFCELISCMRLDIKNADKIKQNQIKTVIFRNWPEKK